MNHVRSANGEQRRDYSKCDRCEGTGKSRAVMESEHVMALKGDERVQAFRALDHEAMSRMFEANRGMYDALMDAAYGEDR